MRGCRERLRACELILCRLICSRTPPSAGRPANLPTGGRLEKGARASPGLQPVTMVRAGQRVL